MIKKGGGGSVMKNIFKVYHKEDPPRISRARTKTETNVIRQQWILCCGIVYHTRDLQNNGLLCRFYLKASSWYSKKCPCSGGQKEIGSCSLRYRSMVFRESTRERLIKDGREIRLKRWNKWSKWHTTYVHGNVFTVGARIDQQNNNVYAKISEPHTKVVLC